MHRQIFKSHGTPLVADVMGEGPTAVLLHAGAERRTVWHPVMRELLAAGFGSLAVDQRGHGESGGSQDDGVQAFGVDAATIIGACHRPVVVGASLGGFAAMLALADPTVRQQTAGLVLVDVVPDPTPGRVRSYLEGRGLSRMSLMEDILDHAEELCAAADTLDLPVLLVRAGRDGAVDDAAAARLARRVPQLRTASVPEAGHLIARHAPQALAALLIDFMHGDAVRDRQLSLSASGLERM